MYKCNCLKISQQPNPPIQAFPHRRKNIWSEALVDVVPLYRPYIWASLLNVPSNAAALYGAVDKETPHPVDRQIEVDIPRWVTSFF